MECNVTEGGVGWLPLKVWCSVTEKISRTRYIMDQPERGPGFTTALHEDIDPIHFTFRGLEITANHILEKTRL